MRSQTGAYRFRVGNGTLVGEHGNTDPLDAIQAGRDARDDFIQGIDRPAYPDKTFAAVSARSFF